MINTSSYREISKSYSKIEMLALNMKREPATYFQESEFMWSELNNYLCRHQKLYKRNGLKS